MHNDTEVFTNSAKLVQEHPDYSGTTSLFRMNGTSMATAVTSGIVALMLDGDPSLTPDQVKYRLMMTARPALTSDADLVYNVFQQGMGRVWAPDAVYYASLVDDRLANRLPDGYANTGMDLAADLAHGWDADGDGLPDASELAYHYQGRCGGW